MILTQEICDPSPRRIEELALNFGKLKDDPNPSSQSWLRPLPVFYLSSSCIFNDKSRFVSNVLYSTNYEVASHYSLVCIFPTNMIYGNPHVPELSCSVTTQAHNQGFELSHTSTSPSMT